MKYAGIDVGAETIKVVVVDGTPLRVSACRQMAHQKSIASALECVLEDLRAAGVDRVAVCGRFVNHVTLCH